MLRRPLCIALLLVAVLIGGFWLDAGALIRSWDETELAVQPPLKTEALLDADARLELSGEGLVEGTRVWLVPEQTQRHGLAAILRTWGNPHLVRISGQRVYLANGKGGVLVIDLRDWSKPRLLGGITLPKQALDLAVSGNLVFVACGQAGLQIVDFSNPAAPRLVAALDLPGSAMALELRDNRIYLASSKDGLHIIDVFEPRHPTLLAHVATPAAALDIALAGNCALLACGNRGIASFDISNPRQPQPLAGGLHPPGFVRCLAGNGTLAYAASYENSAAMHSYLTVYDCSDPGFPRRLEERPLSGDALNVQVHKERLVVALGVNGIDLFDLADPEHPAYLESIGGLGAIRSAVSEGDWVLLADSTGLISTLQRSKQLQLPEIASLQSRIPYGKPLLQNSRMILPLRNGFLQIYAAHDPARPQWQADLPLPGTVAAMTLRDNLLLVAISNRTTSGSLQDGQLMVVSLADPALPQILSRVPLSGEPEGLVFDGSQAIVVQSGPQTDSGPQPRVAGGSMTVIGLADPRQPRVVEHFPLEATPTGLAWRDGYALVSMAQGKLLTFRVDSGKSPEPAGEVTFHWLHQGNIVTQGRGGIELMGGVAVVYCGASELNFVDISQPRRPVLLGSGELPGIIDQLGASGEMLYVGIIGQGIMLYDLTFPWQPRQIGLLALPRSGNSFVVGDEVLWYGGNTKQGMTCIPKPTLAENDGKGDGFSLALHLPSPGAAGDYALWVERDNHWQEIPNAIRFKAP